MKPYVWVQVLAREPSLQRAVVRSALHGPDFHGVVMHSALHARISLSMPLSASGRRALFHSANSGSIPDRGAICSNRQDHNGGMAESGLRHSLGKRTQPLKAAMSSNLIPSANF